MPSTSARSGDTSATSPRPYRLTSLSGRNGLNRASTSRRSANSRATSTGARTSTETGIPITCSTCRMPPTVGGQPEPELCEFCRLPVDRPVESAAVDFLTHHVLVRADKAEAPVRLLVVDDEPHIAELVATVAKYEGWQARVANNGSTALTEA